MYGLQVAGCHPTGIVSLSNVMNTTHELSFTPYGVFTLPDTETNTDTDKKWVVKNCVEVFTLHLHNNAIEYC